MEMQSLLCPLEDYLMDKTCPGELKDFLSKCKVTNALQLAKICRDQEELIVLWSNLGLKAVKTGGKLDDDAEEKHKAHAMWVLMQTRIIFDAVWTLEQAAKKVELKAWERRVREEASSISSGTSRLAGRTTN